MGSHVVSSRETLWSIANDRLGSSLRWRDLARLNYGVVQPDGDALAADHWIRPGWILELPPLRPLHLPHAEDAFGARSTRSIDRPTGAGASAAGALCRVAEGTGVGRGGETGTTVPDESGEATSFPNWRSHVPVDPLGGGIVGAGVVNILDRMRRAQQRHRRTGGLIRLPVGPHGAMERRLRAGEGWNACYHVDQALRLFVRSQHGPEAQPQVHGVIVEDATIDLVLDDAVPGLLLPTGCTVGPDGRSVRLDRAVLPAPDGQARSVDAEPAPVPLLVTAGPGAEGLVMVNVESLGSLVVRGDSEEADSVVRAFALELATSFWAGQFDLVLVGFGAELERFDRVTAIEDVPALAQRLWLRRIDGEDRLRKAARYSFADARSHGAPGRWDPMVVVCGPTTSEHDVGELIDAVAHSRVGSAVVATGDRLQATHEVRLTEAEPSASLELLRSVVVPQRIATAELAEVGGLLNTASARESVLSSEEPYVRLPVRLPALLNGEADDDVDLPVGAHDLVHEHRVRPEIAGRTLVGASPAADNGLQPGTVEVVVLGPVEIRGAARDFTRAWARELVVYLAMHPAGASNEAWATALWPDRLMAPSSLHSTASVARRSLGQGLDGSDHLPRSHGRLALARTVTTDWDRFLALADSGDIDSWRSALALVRGRPFDGLRSSDWPILEGIGPAIESAVVDLSGRLAGAELAAGDARSAKWAARRGLLVSPYDERLYRMLMRAADLAGNLAGVEAVMVELITLVADEIEPFDSVHPSTTELYRTLTRGRSPARRPKMSSGRSE